MLEIQCEKTAASSKGIPVGDKATSADMRVLRIFRARA